MKQLLFIHGGDAFAARGEYLEYLRNESIDDPFVHQEHKRWKKGLAAHLGSEWTCSFPQMPNSSNATYEEWKILFDKLVPFMKDDIVFVGHSLGANFLAKYVSENVIPVGVSQLHLVAGCYGLSGGFDLPESLTSILSRCKNVYIYHSKDDPIVPYTDALRFKSAIPSAQLQTFEDRGHFLTEEFPELVTNIKAN